uniref:Knl1 C-terminal RWD domain-containing protein n=1 Tax=Callorhinchus milii TaxID=7868 RepID=A0A4W3J7G4_CALMI
MYLIFVSLQFFCCGGTMNENTVTSDENADINEEKCKRRQSGILKAYRSPLRTLNETDITQRIELPVKPRKSLRRVSFANTEEVKEFVTEKMLIKMQDLQHGGDVPTEQLQDLLIRNEMPLNTDSSIPGMDALLHAPIQTIDQESELREQESQVLISSLGIRKDDLDIVGCSKSKVTSVLQRKIDFHSFLAGLNSAEGTCTPISHEERKQCRDQGFELKVIPETQKKVDFKSFLDSIKNSKPDEKAVTMSSIFEQQASNLKGIGVSSVCGMGESLERTSHIVSGAQTNSTHFLKPMFLHEQDDVEFTRSHTVAVDHFTLENAMATHSVEYSKANRLNSGGDVLTNFPNKTMVFSGEKCMDMTRSNTLPVNAKGIAQVTAQAELTSKAPPIIYRHMPSLTSAELRKFPGDGDATDQMKSYFGVTGCKAGQLGSSFLSPLVANPVPKSTSFSFPHDQTMVYSEANDMDMTKSHTVVIDGKSLGRITNTLIFSEQSNCMDLTKSHMTAIDSKHIGQLTNSASSSQKLTSRPSGHWSNASFFTSDKTIVSSEKENDMNMTKSHTVAIENKTFEQVTNHTLGSTVVKSGQNCLRSFLESIHNDREIIFSEEPMDITKSHTVAIDWKSLGQTNEVLGSTKRTTRPWSILQSCHSDKTIVFSEEENDMDITKSHTIAIASKTLEQITNGMPGSKVMTCGQSGPWPILQSFHNYQSDKTMLFSEEANDMDMTKSLTVAIDDKSFEQITNGVTGSKVLTSEQSGPRSIRQFCSGDRTVCFSQEVNNMDMTKSHTVVIDDKSLGHGTTGPRSILQSCPANRTMVFAEETNDMDMTKSHTVVIDDKSLGHDRKGTTGLRSILQPCPGNRSMIFSEETNNMDMTKSHTVVIDDKNLRQGTTGPRSILQTCPGNRTMVFSEETNDMDMTKSHTVVIDDKSLGHDRKGTTGPRSILQSCPGNRTMVFSEETNDMDMTKSHTVVIDDKSLGHDRKGTAGLWSILHPCPGNRTMVFSEETNDMDMTKSHTVVIDDKSLRQGTTGPRSILQSCPGNRTMVFSEETNDMDMTKSHTVVIDDKSLGHDRKGTPGLRSILQSCPGNRTMIFSEETNNMDMTKSHTVVIDDKSLRQGTTGPRSILRSCPGNRTMVFSEETNDMDMTKSHTVTIDSRVTKVTPLTRPDLSGPTSTGLSVRTNPDNDTDFGKSQSYSTSSNVHHMIRTSTIGRANSIGTTLNLIPTAGMDVSPTVTTDIKYQSLSGSDEANTHRSSQSPHPPCPGEKTIFFTEVQGDMDVTKSHITAIDQNNVASMLNNQNPSLVTIGSMGTYALSFPMDRTMMYSEQDNMDLTQSCTVVINDKNDTSTTIHTVPIQIEHTVCNSVAEVSKLSLKKDKDSMFTSKPGDLVPFCSSTTTVKTNHLYNAVGQPVHGCNNSTPCAESMTIDISQKAITEADTKHEVCSQFVFGECKNMYQKEMKQPVQYVEKVMAPIVKRKSSNNDLNIQQEWTPCDQIGEAVSNRSVMSNVSNNESKCFADGGTAEPICSSNRSLGSEECSKPSLVHFISTLQRLNTIDGTCDVEMEKTPTALERSQANEKNAVDCQTRKTNASSSLVQSTFVPETFKSKITSLGIFPAKLHSRQNVYGAVTSDHKGEKKGSSEQPVPSSPLSALCSPKRPEEELNAFTSNIELPGLPDVEMPLQMESDMSDGDLIKSSQSFKAAEVHPAVFSNQSVKHETLTANEHDDIVFSVKDRLGITAVVNTVEQSLCQKRRRVEGESEDACNERKMRKSVGHEGAESSSQKVSSTPTVQWGGLANGILEENMHSLLIKSMDCTSNNNSLDSIKGDGDGISAHTSNQRCNQSTNLFMLEKSELHQKLMDGSITVSEFFKLLQIPIHVQKPRQSILPTTCETDKSSALEEWLAIKFIHRPKLRIYEEDIASLSTVLNELKDQLLNLDKRLSEVNLSLWTDVKEMTEDELLQLRSCLNTKKATFVKDTKLICHEQKVHLYSAQLNALKAQRLQIRKHMDSLDEVLGKMEECLVSLDLTNLDVLDDCTVDGNPELTELEQAVNTKKEDLKKLQTEQCDLESQLTKAVARKEFMQEKNSSFIDHTKDLRELLEWELYIWQEDMAVYQFLWETLELHVKFEEAKDGLSSGKKCRRINDLYLVSELDEEEAPSYTKLVHKLVMMAWKNRSWISTCTNESQLPMLLLDVSLEVSRCRLLGEELEFLKTWGAKFDILRTDIEHTDVKCLFSSYYALSKFEVTFHLTPGYPSLPLSFTFNSRFGNICDQHINEVIGTAKPGHEYLTRIVKTIFSTLLTMPGAQQFRQAVS